MNGLAHCPRSCFRGHRVLSAGLGALVLASVLGSCAREVERPEPRAGVIRAILGPYEQDPVSHEQDILVERLVLVDSLGHPGLFLRAEGHGEEVALVIRDRAGREVMRLGGPQVRHAGDEP